MKLNCRAGDLAVIVKAISAQSNLGRFVTCHRLAVHGEMFGAFQYNQRNDGPAWVISVNHPIEWHGDWVMERAMCDSQLRPIRNEPGDDETLIWCDVPSEVTV